MPDGRGVVHSINDTAFALSSLVIGTALGPLTLATLQHLTRGAETHRSTWMQWPRIIALRSGTLVALLLCSLLPIQLAYAWCNTTNSAIQFLQTHSTLDTQARNTAAAEQLRQTVSICKNTIVPVIFVAVVPLQLLVRVHYKVHRVWPHAAWVAVVFFCLATIPTAWCYEASSATLECWAENDARKLDDETLGHLHMCMPFAVTLLLLGALFWAEAALRSLLFNFFWAQPQGTPRNRRSRPATTTSPEARLVQYNPSFFVF